MTYTRAVSTNAFGPAAFIVDATTSNGTHSTIASAITAAVSGQTIFVKPGTYTENLTLKAGVNLTAYGSDSSLNGTGNVIISGTCTLTAAGSVTISGIQLQTNSAALLAVTGSAASIVNLENCYLNCTNATGITFSSSSASAAINIRNCSGNLGTTGIALFSHSSAGTLLILGSDFSNTGASTTANTVSAGSFRSRRIVIFNPTTSSGTGNIDSNWCGFNTNSENVTAITSGGSGGGVFNQCNILGGSASAVSISNTTLIDNSTISSTNTNAITGAGTLTYGGLDFSSTSDTINTTTQTACVYRPGITRSLHQPAFLGYLASTVLNKTGAGTTYTLGTDALTEVFDQNNNFTTAGVFTAPYTGRYFLAGSALLTGNAANVQTTFNINTSNRVYSTLNGHGSTGQNLSGFGDSVCDMDAADTATFTISASGEAGNTADVFGSGNAETRVSGFLIC